MPSILCISCFVLERVGDTLFQILDCRQNNCDYCCCCFAEVYGIPSGILRYSDPEDRIFLSFFTGTSVILK